MRYRERFKRWMAWPGWRRHAPAAGSVVAHAVVALAMAGLLAASGKPIARSVVPPEKLALEVALVPESLPTPVIRQPASPRPAPSRATGDVAPPVAQPRKDQRQPNVAPVTNAAPSASDSVYLGPSPFALPTPKGGLEGLAGNDPCTTRVGLKPKDCVTNWAASVGAMDSVLPRTKQDMQRYHAEFMTPCQWRVGCEPTDGVLNNGARSFGNKSPMASGAGGVQGINELVGRLGFNPDHTDPGFGD